jgi:hypothetical protein
VVGLFERSALGDELDEQGVEAFFAHGNLLKALDMADARWLCASLQARDRRERSVQDLRG